MQGSWGRASGQAGENQGGEHTGEQTGLDCRPSKLLNSLTTKCSFVCSRILLKLGTYGTTQKYRLSCDIILFYFSGNTIHACIHSPGILILTINFQMLPQIRTILFGANPSRHFLDQHGNINVSVAIQRTIILLLCNYVLIIVN